MKGGERFLDHRVLGFVPSIGLWMHDAITAFSVLVNINGGGEQSIARLKLRDIGYIESERCSALDSIVRNISGLI